MPGPCWWTGNSKSGRARATKACSVSRTTVFNPRQARRILGPKIFALFEGRDGQLWAGTQNGLANFDGQKWRLFTTRDGLAKCRPRHRGRRRRESLGWHGEQRLESCSRTGNSFPTVPVPTACPATTFPVSTRKTEGVLWVGTGGHGLARLENGKWARYATTNGLVSDSINYITEDDAGYLWIGCNAGLMRLPKQSLNDFAAGRTNVISCRTYGKADGLPTRECSAGSQPADVPHAATANYGFPPSKAWRRWIPRTSSPTRSRRSVMIESVLVDRPRTKNQPAGFDLAAVHHRPARRRGTGNPLYRAQFFCAGTWSASNAGSKTMKAPGPKPARNVSRAIQNCRRGVTLSTSRPATRTTSGAATTRRCWPSSCSRNSGRRLVSAGRPVF